MKTLSKTALNEKAVPVFKVHPNATVLYATSDGQFFLNKNRAELHANGNKLSVHDISRPEVEDEPAKAPKEEPVAKKKSKKEPKADEQ